MFEATLRWCRSHCAGNCLLVSTYASQGVCVREYLCARVLRHERYPEQTPPQDIGFPCGGEISL